MALTTITTGCNDQVTWQQSRWVYWIERDGIGIAKYNPVATRNNDEFTSPEDARDVYLYYYKKAAHYTLPSVNATTWESETHEMPSQFHQHLVEKAIAMGYELKPNGLGQAQYFEAKYEAGVRRGRKFAYRGRTSTIKQISPTDY